MKKTDDNWHLDWVDGMKGICCLIVVICHTFVTISGMSVHAQANIPLFHNLYDGNFAVSAFIILSTILTCHGIELHNDDLLTRYRYIVAKRYFRLVVPVGFIIILMYFSNWGGLFYAEEYGCKTGNSWLMNITEKWNHLPGSILGAPIQGAFVILRVSWMLPYVFFASMWVIILDLLLRDKTYFPKVFLMFLACYIAWKCDFYYVNVVAGYALYQTIILPLNNRKRCLLIIIATIVFVLSDFYGYTDQWNMLRAICFVGVATFSKRIKTIFSVKYFKWLGGISMNIYLLHLFVIYVVTCRMADCMEHSMINLFVIYLTTVVLTIVLAYCFTRYIEVYLNKFTNKIMNFVNS